MHQTLLKMLRNTAVFNKEASPGHSWVGMVERDHKQVNIKMIFYHDPCMKAVK